MMNCFLIARRQFEATGRMAEDGNGTLGLAQVTPADVLLLDTSVKGRGFLDILRRVRAAQPELRVLVLSGNAEVAFAVRVLKAGAFGYLTKYSSAEELAEAIGVVQSGHKYVSPALGDVVAHLLTTPADTPDHAQLTARSRNSGEYRFCVFITLSSQRIESPGKPGRFTTKICDAWQPYTSGNCINFLHEST